MITQKHGRKLASQLGEVLFVCQFYDLQIETKVSLSLRNFVVALSVCVCVCSFPPQRHYIYHWATGTHINETDGRPADDAIQSRIGWEEMGEDQGMPNALRAERNWRKTKYAEAGRQNLVLNVWNEHRPWLSYISPHVFTPKEGQEGWTNGRFPHTKLKLCHKGVLLQNLKGPPIRRSTVFQILIELATTGPNL